MVGGCLGLYLLLVDCCYCVKVRFTGIGWDVYYVMFVVAGLLWLLVVCCVPIVNSVVLFSLV